MFSKIPNATFQRELKLTTSHRSKVCCFTTGFNIEDCPMDKKVIIGENA
jgi:hypothetical protein